MLKDKLIVFIDMQKKGLYQWIIKELTLDLSEFEDGERTRCNLATTGAGDEYARMVQGNFEEGSSTSIFVTGEEDPKSENYIGVNPSYMLYNITTDTLTRENGTRTYENASSGSDRLVIKEIKGSDDKP